MVDQESFIHYNLQTITTLVLKAASITPKTTDKDPLNNVAQFVTVRNETHLTSCM